MVGVGRLRLAVLTALIIRAASRCTFLGLTHYRRKAALSVFDGGVVEQDRSSSMLYVLALSGVNTLLQEKTGKTGRK